MLKKQLTQERLDEIAERAQDFALELVQAAKSAEQSSLAGLDVTRAAARINQLTRAAAELNHWLLYSAEMAADRKDLEDTLRARASR